jgi:formate hydrogenlyase transcriptional activator
VANRGAKEIDERQRGEIERVLEETKGRVGGAEGAAARLGINRTTLLARMKKLRIDPKLFSFPVMAST